jgi:hypothetical protein
MSASTLALLVVVLGVPPSEGVRTDTSCPPILQRYPAADCDVPICDCMVDDDDSNESSSQRRMESSCDLSAAMRRACAALRTQRENIVRHADPSPPSLIYAQCALLI